MLFHASIDANDPERVARVLAELWRGKSSPFYDGYIAWPGDERGTQIEIYSRGTVGLPQGVTPSFDPPARYTPTHLAIGIPLTETEALAVAEREGWPATKRDRGGAFNVIELWIEGRQMVELLTREEQERYKAFWQTPGIGDIFKRMSQGLQQTTREERK